MPAAAPAHEDIEIQVRNLTGRISETPGDAALYVRRGQLHRLHQDLARALHDFARALEIDPSHVGALVGRSEALLDKGEPEGARAAAARATEIAPASVGAHHARARALAALGRTGDADAAYAEAASLQSDPTPEFILEHARMHLDQSPPARERALEILEDGLDKLGLLVTLADPKIDIHLAAGQPGQALALCDRMLGTLGQNPIWLVRRAEILAELGRDAESRQAYLAARSTIDRLPARRQKTAAIADLASSIDQALAPPTPDSQEP